jgi:uncharacterized RDD family membrane protein YckC
VTSPDTPTPRDVLAPISRRALGLAIDSLLIALPVGALALATGVTSLDEVATGELLMLTVAWLVIGVGYETIGIAVWGRTVGKAILGIRVVDATDGTRVSWTYAAVRSLVPAAAGLVPWIGFALTMIVYLRAAMHPMRQGLHDAAAGTLVVMRAAD